MFEAKNYAYVMTRDIDWSDMDAYQHINNSVYFRYFEEARVRYFAMIGVHDFKAQHAIGPILANTSCNFKHPLLYPDTITVAVNCELASDKKMLTKYVIYSQSQQVVVAEGEALVVYYDYQQACSHVIPEPIKYAVLKGR